ncbi:diaminopimelate epimerase [Haloimpatiens sp. FM7330]|uniref:diaminopimelate epimerase n=1 Tax=Haloimpatiens sp. FM7330 TaxID=3298610 RepID=UPI00362F750C
MKFTKMHGCGNDFILIEDLNENINDLNDVAKKLCDRHFGIGADGILVVRNTDEADIEMIIINADGSYAAMCGNGIRCFAKYVLEKGIVKGNRINIKTGDGIKKVLIDSEDEVVKKITINMGKPNFKPQSIPSKSCEEIVNKEVVINNKNYKITSLLMGVPHTAIFGKLDEFNINEGKYIEKYELFEDGTNVNFIEVLNKDEIKVKTWERGAGATLACGTGCCASVAAGNRLGLLNKKVRVYIPGGELIIELKDGDIFMTGSAESVFKGECEI